MDTCCAGLLMLPADYKASLAQFEGQPTQNIAERSNVSTNASDAAASSQVPSMSTEKQQVSFLVALHPPSYSWSGK